MICVVRQARMRQAGHECADHPKLELGSVMRASGLKIVPRLAESLYLRRRLHHDPASQELGYLRMCDGAPCWDLVVRILWTVDVEKAVDASELVYVQGGRSSARDLLSQLSRIYAEQQQAEA